jgi:hypothetical protein
LSLLSNTQFVESRVSDDDEEETSTNKIESSTNNAETSTKKVDSNPEEVFCRKVGQALAAGADFVEGAFETVEVS